MSGVIRHGHRDGYRWCWSVDGDMWGLVEAIPELVVGCVVAVTALDSGPLRLSGKESSSGWATAGDVAWSPRIEDPEQLPSADWDEWYVFVERVDFAPPDVFVNYGNFCPALPDASPKATWCRAAFADDLRRRQEVADLFWRHLVHVQPITYLAGGDTLTCVTQDDRLADRVLEALGGQPTR